eukprot:CAMPEP_0175911756 /NCGR_PEP_ID=MMETSP0108-20121206/8363_1 /TAXON_ID=195067 ORGANISM="Goniomonas pacifica, Strain CCMP1869" /NCGR_SAMPLE_ID=MMETSP0108 /ASSEMBLY_ACC=CAM_ASM_000204 /LENGTH=459 /DNA_ID=CAMNT_0017234023 /DNA_START=8 /DNA_END=1387 /DNA_ORIENTATION=-
MTADEKQMDVGLCEALVNVTRTFSPERPAETMHTDRFRQFMLEVEESIWMVLAVRNVVATRTAKDGKTVNEPKPLQHCDAVLHQGLRSAYRLYKMFNGTMTETMAKSSAETLRQKLSMFFTPYLNHLVLDSTDLAASFSGIRYFPLDKRLFLSIQSFRLFLSIQSFNHILRSTFSPLAFSLCIYHDHLVWSSLPEHDETRLVYNYLVTQVNGVTPDASLPVGRRAPPHTPIASDSPPLFGAATRSFVIPLEECAESLAPAEKAVPCIPLIYLGQGRVYHLVVFRHKRMLWTSLIDERKHVDAQFLKAIAEFLFAQVRALEKSVAEQDGRMSAVEEPYRYLYFNHMNLALKNTVRSRSGTPVSREALVLLSEIHDEFSGTRESGTAAEADHAVAVMGDTHSVMSEVYIRTAQDGWVVGLQTNKREFFVVSDQKNHNLQEIHEEISRLVTHYFNNIFLSAN